MFQNCKFGVMCKNPNCIYVHPNSQAANKSHFKWVSNKTTNATTATSTGQSASDATENGGSQNESQQQLTTAVSQIQQQIPAKVQ